MIRAIEGLKKEAQSATKFRGHSMRWGLVKRESSTFPWFTQLGSCKFCGMSVQLKTHPAPNEIQIGGEAVALNCTKVENK